MAADAAGYRAPHPLAATHDLSGFDCGEPELDDWLRRRALRNQASRASRTFVVTRGDVVAGYHALAVGSVARIDTVNDLRRNMPDPIPVMVLGRLAVHRPFAGAGVGAGLLKDAIHRTLAVSEMAGVAALVVHAKHEKAAGFYLRHGFRPSPLRELVLMLPVRELAASLP